MLVLSRKESEKIRIGDDIVVTVVTIDRGKIKIGIEAPIHAKVMREEILPGRKAAIAESLKVAENQK
jgi:carbon storage regulator